MVNRFILILAAGLLLAGFTFGSVGIQLRCDDIDGLKKSDRVIFEEAFIGKVDKIVYGDDGIYTVSIVIEKDFNTVATEHTRFTIGPDPEYDGRKAVELIQIHIGGTPLKNGSTAEVSDKYSVLLEMMKDDVQDGIGYLKKEYRKFSHELQSLSEHEKVRELKKMMTRLGEELKKESRETREKIATEIIPMLEHEIEMLREQLKADDREKEIEPLEKELKNIKYI